MFDDPITAAFMILAVILAVIAGLWFGTVLGESAAAKDKQKDGKPAPRRSFREPSSQLSTLSSLSRCPQTVATSCASRLPSCSPRRSQGWWPVRVG